MFHKLEKVLDNIEEEATEQGLKKGIEKVKKHEKYGIIRKLLGIGKLLIDMLLGD